MVVTRSNAVALLVRKLPLDNVGAIAVLVQSVDAVARKPCAENTPA
jgi:hypothetical protein